MSPTPTYGWPLPTGPGPVNVPGDIANLGNAIDAAFADSGWQNVSVAGGFAAMTGTELPQVRKIGKVVYLRGGWLNTGMSASGTHTVGTVPAGFRPPINAVCAVGSSTGAASAAMLLIQTGGQCELRLGATLGAYYKMDRQCYLVD